MARHVIASRLTYQGDWRFYMENSNLQLCLNEAASCAEFWPARQWAVFTKHPPAPYWSGKARYVFGLSDAELYERKFGESMPLGSACGALVQTLDRDALH